MTRWHIHLGLASRSFGILCPAGYGVDMRGWIVGPLGISVWRFYPVVNPSTPDTLPTE